MTSHKMIEARVLNGEPLSISGQQSIAMSMVAITQNLSLYPDCSGVLIAANAILTAAHCVMLEGQVVENQYALLGPQFIADLNKDSSIFKNAIPFKKVIIHDQFIYPNTYADLAIVILEKDVPGEYIPAKIYTGVELDDYLPLVVAGASITNESSINDSTEQMLNEFYNFSEFQFDSNFFREDKFLGGNILFRQVSSMPFKIENSPDSLTTISNLGNTTKGDSGGGLYIQLNGEYYLAGIHSSAYGPNNKFWSHVAHSTKLKSHKDWIVKNLLENNIQLPTFISIESQEELEQAIDKKVLECNYLNLKLYDFHRTSFEVISSAPKENRCELIQEFYHALESGIEACHQSCPDSGATKGYCTFYERGRNKLTYTFTNCDF
ncbi:MAG: trypsin-like serine protease [Bacteriovoracaceae bacterium]